MYVCASKNVYCITKFYIVCYVVALLVSVSSFRCLFLRRLWLGGSTCPPTLSLLKGRKSTVQRRDDGQNWEP